MLKNYEKITKALAASLGLTADELVRCFNRATVADIAALCELMCLGFGVVENLSPEIIAWRYFNFSKNISDIFVLRYQGNLIGAVGAEPITVKAGDKEYQGICAADIVVHPDHMKRGIGAWMNLHLQHIFPIVMVMGSNEKSNTLLRRLFKPMKCRNHFKMLFSVKGYLEVRGWPHALIDIISGIASPSFEFLYKPFLKKLPKTYEVVVSENTEDLKEFFSNPRYQSRNLNINVRSAAYCRWRYDLNPKSQFRVLRLQENNNLIGYAVVRINRENVLQDWQLMDWDLFSDVRNEENHRLLFSAAATYAKENGAQSLCVLASDKLSYKSLCKTGFSHRAIEDGFFLWAQESVDPKVYDENHWFLSYCDTDEAL